MPSLYHFFVVDVTSAMIDYSKGDLQARVVNSPPTKHILVHVSSLLPLQIPKQSVHMHISPSRCSGGRALAPNRQLQMDVEDNIDDHIC